MGERYKEVRKQLADLTKKGKATAYKIKHAHVLLKADVDGPAWTVGQIAEDFSMHANTVSHIHRRFVEQGPDAALNRKKRLRPPRERKLDGESEARLPLTSVAPSGSLISKVLSGASYWDETVQVNSIASFNAGKFDMDSFTCIGVDGSPFGDS